MAEEAKAPAAAEVKAAETKQENVIPQARLDQEVARRHKVEEELAVFRKAQEEAGKKTLEEQNKFKELYEAEKVKASAFEEVSTSLQEFYSQETKDLTDEQKALIPDLPIHKKLTWVKKAREAGVLGAKTKEAAASAKPSSTAVPSPASDDISPAVVTKCQP